MNNKEPKKRPLTTGEYFNLIKARLEQKGMLPDILEYGLPTFRPAPIRTYQFDLRSNLDYGCSEGIYLDLAITYYEDEEVKHDNLGTFKTLSTSREAMRTMARLLADFIVEESSYANAHLDDFTWSGIDVYAVSENGKIVSGKYTCGDRVSAEKRKEELLGRYPHVLIRDNATRIEKHYRSADNYSKGYEGRKQLSA